MNTKKNCKIRIIVYSILSFAVLTAVVLSDIVAAPEIHASLEHRFLPPSIRHLFGTDDFGRDVFLRTLQGFKYTFLLGGIIGLFAGYYGGLFDEILYYLCNIILSFPMIAAVIFFSAVFGNSIFILIVLSIIFGMIFNIKVVRSEIMILKHSDFVTGLKIIGASDLFIVTRHLLKPAFILLLPTFPLILGHIIIGISAYSFLGFGVQPPHPEIGLMLKEAIRFINYAPWLMVCPGLFQFSVILIFADLSEAVQNFMQYARDIRRKI